MNERSDHDVIDQVFGNYRIVSPLGTGGMGRVYRAQHIHLDREIAIKLLHPHLAADASFRARFLQEARAASLLEHQNIVRLYDYGEQGGLLYLMMELLTDGSLRSHLKERAGVTANRSIDFELDLIRQAADGLSFAHQQGMVHRDIKPDNLLLKVTAGANGSATILKVADFGLAHLADEGVLTASGVTLGTPAYMSPEQCQGRSIDSRSDVYSLGIVLYEVAVGRVPFSTRSLSDAIYSHVYVAPPPPKDLRPDLPDELSDIILRALAKRPEDRYQQIGEMAEALRRLSSTSGFAAPMPMPDVDDSAQMTPATGISAQSGPPSGTTPPPAAPPGGVQIPRLFVLGADGEVQQVVNLTGSGLTVGRLDNNDVVLNEPGVSRHHLMIDWNGGEATVTDLGSSNGTLLGGLPLPPHVPRPWNVTDDLRIGPLQLRLARPVPTTPAASAVGAAGAVGAGAAVPLAAAGAIAADTPAVPDASIAESAPAAFAATSDPASLGGGDYLPPQPALAGAGAGSEAARRGPTVIILAILVLALLGAGAFLLTRGDDDESSLQATGSTPTPRAAGTAAGTTQAVGVVGTATVSSAATSPAATTQTAAITTVEATAAAATLTVSSAIPTQPALEGEPITVGGAAVAVSSTANEETVLSFDATAGQRVMLEATDIAVGPGSGYGGRIAIIAANGSELASTAMWSTEPRALIDVVSIPIAGNYGVVVRPEAGFSYSANITLLDVQPDTTAEISVSGDPVSISTNGPGNIARVTFTTQARQQVFIEITDILVGPTSGYGGTVRLTASNGSEIARVSLWATESRAFIDTTALPFPGTYTLIIDPEDTFVASATLKLIGVPGDITQTITVGGPAVDITIADPGQNARITFQATANQRVTVVISNISIGPTTGYSGQLRILGQNDSVVANGSIWSTEPQATMEAVVLPVAGTYTILIDPIDTNIFTGSVTIQNAP